MLSNVLDVDTEFDIEAELEDDEYAHAIPFCYQHRGVEWFPVPGTIAQALCGRLIRVNNPIMDDDNTKKKCDDCVKFHGPTNCYVCGKQLWG